VAAPALPEPWARSWPAVAASVAQIRAAVVAFAMAAGAGEAAIEAVRLAVSEAATNAVLHAYVEQPTPGDVHVAADHRPGTVCVDVRDDGRGMVARSDSPGSGFGLMLIGQYADDHEVRALPEGGTSLRMRFSLAG
jgi:serine/threonine-protein kinase RsbW/stage II sporulation protein AB (anti-sigma F factor)